MATAIIHSARRMLAGRISAAGPVCGPIQLMVARPKASAPQASDQGPIRQLASPSPSPPAVADMSSSSPAQNTASAMAPQTI